MAIRITTTGAVQVDTGVWSFEMPPHQVRQLGSATCAFGEVSVVVLDACTFHAGKKELQFNMEDVVPINIGTTARVIAINGGISMKTAPSTSPVADSNSRAFGPGDREFLNLAQRELSPSAAAVAERLLAGVRERFAGNLKRGKARNFSETPDNFWYVILQPRIDEISITVRGDIDHFAGVADLQIKDDRGNTRFKVRNEQDVPSALKLIFHARRKY